ncbi:hypothetical protein NQ315_004139 [Exocentrus adspersus]|uniref:Peptidase S1 domain-containing protein n=1 Tax=Exocentrus adspersus TaxID=1586481 RepID=A0AAV8W6H1_9CUCU|nr:hypothetical protein NQ315_004139 [Exocentrus adspersus]
MQVLLLFLTLTQVIGLITAKENVSQTVYGKIVGGKPVNIEDYPYQLSLQLSRRHICGAAMIGSKWALTAAHCTYGLPAVNLTIRAGTTFYGYDGEVVSVKRVHEHPSYNDKTQDYDISVLELQHDITTKKASKISMASWYNFLFPWLSGTATGWGTTREEGVPSWQLRAVTVPIVNYYKCYLSYGPLLTSHMFCAGKHDKDSCQGDSGGPLVISGKLYGITSFGVGCGRPDFPGVYTRVSVFRSFIKGVSGI